MDKLNKRKNQFGDINYNTTPVISAKQQRQKQKENVTVKIYGEVG
jgi:hypothetical protein